MGRRNSPINRQYRGRRKSSTALLVLVTVLAVLLVIGVLFVLSLGRYIEYTQDGVRLNLPWLQEEPAVSPSSDASDLIVTDQPEEPSPSQEEPIAVETGPLQLSAVEVSPSAVTDGTAAALVAASGGNALVVTVKDLEGHLAWQSSNELAVAARDKSGVSLNGSAEFSQAVRALAQQDELYLVARVNCFEDLWMCVYSRSMALTTQGGKLWYDSDGMPWLSPANADARAYLTALCQELAELGFDEILLDCAGFPSSGRKTSIAVGGNYPNDLTGAASTWLAELDGALGDSGVWLSVQVGSETLTAGDSTGLTAQGLAAAADRVWLDGSADTAACAQALTQAGLEEAQERLVLTGLVPAGWSGSRCAMLE
jgi:hypothetical protein